MPRCAIRGQSPAFLAADDHNCPLLHQATQKGQLRENLALGQYRLIVDGVQTTKHKGICSPSTGKPEFLLHTPSGQFGGASVNKRANKLSTRFLWLHVHHCNRIHRFFFFFKSRFKGLSSSIYFSVTKLPETCSVAVFIF